MEDKKISVEEKELAKVLNDAKKDEHIYSNASMAIQFFVAGLKAALSCQQNAQNKGDKYAV